MDILYLVDRLENLIASSRRMPLVNQIIVKEPDILNIVDQMRTVIPDEIKQARRIIQEKERIIAQAQADATALLSRAREETERAIDREGLLHTAEERSHELLQLAEAQAEQLKVDADAYVAETLRALREHLSAIEMNISRDILSIEKGLDSLESSQDYGEMDGERQVIDAYDDYDGYPQSDAMSSQSQPRRSSLAADTMGGPPVYQQDPPDWNHDR